MATLPKPPGSPSWYIPYTPGDIYAASANAILPYLSVEDQRILGKYLGNKYRNFAEYSNTDFGEAPKSISPELRSQYLSSNRASSVLSSLYNMYGGHTPTKSPGFTYLQNVAQALQKYGGNGGAMSRADYQEFVNSVNNLSTLNEGKDKEKWQSLANYLINPTFSAGPLMTSTQTNTGRTIYGKPNTRLFT